jgi:hypothetical protein
MVPDNLTLSDIEQERMTEAIRIGPRTEEQEMEFEADLAYGRQVREMQRTEGWQNILYPHLLRLQAEAKQNLETCNSVHAIDYARPQERLKVIQEVLDGLENKMAASDVAAKHFNSRSFKK